MAGEAGLRPAVSGLREARRGGRRCSGRPRPRGAKVLGGIEPARVLESRQPCARDAPGAQAGARSCFTPPGPARRCRYVTRNTARGPSRISSRAHIQRVQTAPGPRARPEALQVARAPALSGTVARGGDPTRSSPPTAAPAGADAALQGALSPRVRFRGTTFQTALEGRVGSGTESRARKRPL